MVTSLIDIPLHVLQNLASTLTMKLAMKLQRYILGTAKLIQSDDAPDNLTCWIPFKAPIVLSRCVVVAKLLIFQGLVLIVDIYEIFF